MGARVRIRSAKGKIVDVLQHLLQNKSFVLQHEPSFDKALAAYRASAASFADYLIHAESEGANCDLLTFDRRLAKTARVTVLPS